MSPGFDHWPQKDKKIVDQECLIACVDCLQFARVSIGAVYKQHRRGNPGYICRSCSGKKGWTPEKRKEASERARKLWADPKYAGTIQGKAMANEIKKDFGL